LQRGWEAPIVLHAGGVSRGSTCWLFHNRGNGTFEDVTAKSGIFDTSRNRWAWRCSISIGMGGWIWWSRTTRSRTSCIGTLRNGTFDEIGVRAGIAFSEDGKARAGMGIDVADYDNSGASGIVVTNFDDEMIALYRTGARGSIRMLHEDRDRAGVAQ
jgi:enediyne biosynthesis protein E4